MSNGTSRAIDAAARREGLNALSDKFLGIPYVVWGFASLVFAAVWIVVWPQDQAAGATGLRFLVLRWAHALVWLLLAAAAFTAGSRRSARVAEVLGWSALAVYAVFLAVMVVEG